MLFVCMWFEVKLFFLRCLVNRFLCMLFVSVCDNFMHNFTVILHLIQLDWQEHNVFVSLSPSLSLTQLIILSLCLQDVVVLLICLFVRLFSILFARERSCVLVYSINYIPIPMHGICAPNAEMFYPQFSFQCITHRQCKCMQLLETCTFVAQNIRNASLFIDFLFARLDADCFFIFYCLFAWLMHMPIFQRRTVPVLCTQRMKQFCTKHIDCDAMWCDGFVTRIIFLHVSTDKNMKIYELNAEKTNETCKLKFEWKKNHAMQMHIK